MNTMKKTIGWALLVVAAFEGGAANLLNGDFEEVENGQPRGWKASSPFGGFVARGEGWEGSNALGAEDGGSNNCKWVSSPVMLEPGRLYGFAAKLKLAMHGGGITMGTPEVNVTENVADTQGKWIERRVVLLSRNAARPYGEVFRLGEYHLTGRALFDNARVVPLTARYAQKDGVELGHGERLAGNVYSFASRYTASPRLHSRTLAKMDGSFNTSRWMFGKGQMAEYRHEVKGHNFLSGHVRFTSGVVPPGSSAKLMVEASTDGKNWVTVGEKSDIPAMGIAFELPSSLFPAAALHVRFGGNPVMVDGYSLSGVVDGDAVYLAGHTTYLEEDSGKVFHEEGAGVELLDETCGDRLEVEVPGGSIWTTSSGWKVARYRSAPTSKVSAVRVKTAANEAEAVQLCFTASEDFADVRVQPMGEAVARRWGIFEQGRLPASAIVVDRVGYVPVYRATDYLGNIGLNADPILPQTSASQAVKRGETQPFWVRVKPPRETPKGIYRTLLAMSLKNAAGQTRVLEVPLEIEVFGFALPDVMTLKTPFGFGSPTVYRYHRAKTEAERQLLFDRYLRALADYHITPYNFNRHVWKVTWTKSGEPEIDWSEWDAEMEAAFAKYHFTSFRISSLGLGSGNEAQSWPGQVPGSRVKEGDAQYEPMIAKYLKAVQDHFEAKGWLDKAFVYCYDEPRAGADKFVMRGFGLLEKYAPKLRRMLTAPLRDSLIGGPHIWCPVAPDLHTPAEKARRQAGDEFWWYCCMCPRAPYLSLFIDHPGLELRTWLWQTWGEGLTGALIWNTTWWTSDLIYPKSGTFQNAYEDTMSWSPREWRPGTNGDGRLFYPPLACFDGGKDFVDEMPVPTRRLEMIRDGVEDYEYFAMLRRRRPDHPLLKVPADVYSSLTEYNYDPAALEAHRERLARALEE